MNLYFIISPEDYSPEGYLPFLSYCIFLVDVICSTNSELTQESSSVTYSIEEMDNRNQSRSRPLGYDALKSVLKSMSVERR